MSKHLQWFRDLRLRVYLVRSELGHAIDSIRQEWDLDQRMCCSGDECYCQGSTIREFYESERQHWLERRRADPKAAK